MKKIEIPGFEKYDFYRMVDKYVKTAEDYKMMLMKKYKFIKKETDKIVSL